MVFYFRVRLFLDLGLGETSPTLRTLWAYRCGSSLRGNTPAPHYAHIDLNRQLIYINTRPNVELQRPIESDGVYVNVNLSTKWSNNSMYNENLRMYSENLRL